MDVDSSLNREAETLGLLKALAHESRLRLVALIADGEHSVQSLAQRLGLKEPTVSHHLRILREAGIATSRADGTTHYYSLRLRDLQARARGLFSRERIAAFADPVALEDDEARVVANYLGDDGRLKSFPARRTKRRVVLAWLAGQFEEGRRYSEPEVNEIIERRHHDRETFRRELVGYNMLARKAGRYWRTPKSDWAKE